MRQRVDSGSPYEARFGFSRAVRSGNRVRKAIGQAHRETSGDAAPAATTVVVAALLDPRWQVEIEAEAELEAELD